ncbi:NYN domain-containing protein [Pseudomonas aeruginosa]|nr:NYN domain-containing protein [Pseudomonas aeruginosa]
MDRLGIFVDAGYLFAQGSLAISGNVQKRLNLSINEQAVITQLTQTADELSGGIPLLRIYWYDAIGSKGPTLEQKRLANSNNVKVRMGTLNGSGEQKGVDSMIVIDMIELARNHAITDAVLVSGDEDVRVGVQFAQSYGVRVHLIGIAAATGKNNQSPSLVQEADTQVNWNQDVIQSFLTIRQPVTGREPVASQSDTPAAPSAEQSAQPAAQATSATSAESPPEQAQVEEANAAPQSDAPTEEHGAEPAAEDPNAILAAVADRLTNELIVGDLNKLKEVFQSSNSLPPEFDGKLLWRGKTALSRALQPAEKGVIRRAFRDAVKAK